MDNVFITKKDILNRVLESYVLDEKDDKIYKIVFNRENNNIFSNCYCETDFVLKKEKLAHGISICDHIKLSLSVAAKQCGIEIEFLDAFDEFDFLQKDYYVLQNSFNHSILVRDKK